MPKSRHRRRKSRPTRAKKRPERIAGLELAEDLIEEGELGEAKDLLHELEKKYPADDRVIYNLAFVYYELGDPARQLVYARRLCELRPRSARDMLALGSVYAMNEWPALALRTWRSLVEKWPEDKDADQVRTWISALEPVVLENIAAANWSGEEAIVSAEMHEEVQVLLSENRFDQGSKLALKLIERHPEYAPARNNLTLIQFFSGKTDEAIRTARGVLAFAPDNFQANANLARLLAMKGERVEALQLAERLRPVKPINAAVWLKKAETFTFLSDDRAVLEAFEDAERADELGGDSSRAFLHHLAAVAALHLGKEGLARKYWRRALDLQPGLDQAASNLEDMDRPVGERHGPWAYSFHNWFPRQTLNELLEVATRVARKTSDDATLEEFLAKHREVAVLVPFALERGDPDAADFAIKIVQVLKRPELLQAVKDFALGKRGSDRMRNQAALLAVEAGVLPAGEIRMWIDGEWRTVNMMGFEITDKPDESRLPAKATSLLRQSIDELGDGNAVRAEQLLRRALKMAPNDTSLLYNLSVALGYQGRKAEHRKLVEEIHESDPDYLFARAQMARFLLESGDLEKASEMLEPLLRRRRLHFTEMAALTGAQIELLLKQGRSDAAKSWLSMFEQVCPDHPDIEVLRLLIERGGEKAWRLAP